MSTHTQTHGHDDHHEIGPKTLFIVWLGLTVLTVVTVYIATVDFGRALNIIVAMAIASVKASIVAYYFMHLKFEDKLTWVYALYPMFLLFLLIATTIMETFTRNPALY